MDYGTAIIGALAIIICFIPVYLIGNSTRKKRNYLLNLLQGLATQNKSTISEKEFFRDYAIGIDQKEGMVYFVKSVQEKNASFTIDLNKMSHCTIQKKERSVPSKTGPYNITEQLDLTFTPKNKGNAVINLPFYSIEDSLQVTGELQSIKKWEIIINDYLLKS
jgi:hypothetical protein